MKGVIAEIYRADYDSVMNKFHKIKSVTVPCEGGVFEPNDERPEVVLVKRKINSDRYPLVEEYIHAEPANKEPGEWFAFGGTYISCSDSRFPSRYPIPLHDRRMNLEAR